MRASLTRFVTAVCDAELCNDCCSFAASLALPLLATGAKPLRLLLPGHLATQFRRNVYIFNPTMPQSEIQATVDSIASQQVSNQFGNQRYALLFEPGTYGSSSKPLNFQVGYLHAVAGLGSLAWRRGHQRVCLRT